MSALVHLFGYGSLMSHPERPEAVAVRTPARLRGVRRAFNKRSAARGCRAEVACAAAGPLGFERGGHRDSLALGTEVAAGSAMVGLVLSYPATLAGEVLAATDAREGYDPEARLEDCGYVRAEVRVEPLGGGPALTAWTWLSNEAPDARWHLPASVPLADRAAILAAATPRVAQPRPLGLRYLEDVRATLLAHGIVDPDLERLAAQVLTLQGPWRGWMRPAAPLTAEAV